MAGVFGFLLFIGGFAALGYPFVFGGRLDIYLPLAITLFVACGAVGIWRIVGIIEIEHNERQHLRRQQQPPPIYHEFSKPQQ